MAESVTLALAGALLGVLLGARAGRVDRSLAAGRRAARRRRLAPSLQEGAVVGARARRRYTGCVLARVARIEARRRRHALGRLTMTSRLIALVLAAAVAPAALAFNANVPAAGLPSASEFSGQVLPERPDVVSWKALAQVEPVKQGNRMIPQVRASPSSCSTRASSACRAS